MTHQEYIAYNVLVVHDSGHLSHTSHKYTTTHTLVYISVYFTHPHTHIYNHLAVRIAYTQQTIYLTVQSITLMEGTEAVGPKVMFSCMLCKQYERGQHIEYSQCFHRE